MEGWCVCVCVCVCVCSSKFPLVIFLLRTYIPSKNISESPDITIMPTNMAATRIMKFVFCVRPFVVFLLYMPRGCYPPPPFHGCFQRLQTKHARRSPYTKADSSICRLGMGTVSVTNNMKDKIGATCRTHNFGRETCREVTTWQA
jgi:hypothetical protein